jgi:hypothetical protein
VKATPENFMEESAVEYHKVHSEICEARQTDYLTNLEFKEMFKRNFQQDATKEVTDPEIKEEVDAFMHWIGLTGIVAPVYDIHPERIQRKSSMWKHLSMSNTGEQNKE